MSALAAITVAQKYPVFPCSPANKRPRTEHGFKDASRDETQILYWWGQHNDSLVGIPTGHASGVFIVDDDTAKKPDAASSAWVAQRRHLLESTFNYPTRSGGRHYVFQMPVDLDLRSKQGLKVDGAELASIDTRGNGGYAIWWAVHGSAATGEIKPLPPELIADLTQASAPVPLPPSTPPGDWDPDETRRALVFIDAGKGYEKWCDIGMALHHASGGSDEGLALFNEWSQSAPAVYVGMDDCRAHWVSFKSKPGKVVKTIATLFMRAKEGGYSPPPRAIDPATIGFGRGAKPAGLRPLGTTPPVPNAAPDELTLPTLVCAEAIKVEVIEWLWQYWLALSKFHILAGGKSDGKSTLLLNFGATVTRGEKWPDGTQCKKPGYFVVWSGEDGIADTIVPRLKLMKADMSRVFFLEGAKNHDGSYQPFDPSTDIARLDKQIGALSGGPVLVMIDPVISVVRDDMHKANNVREALAPLVRLAADHKCVAVGITHFTKGTKGTNPLERVLGSQAFAALARVVMVTAKDDENARRVLMRAGSNIGPSTGGFAYNIAVEPLPDTLNAAGEPVDYARIVWGEAIDGNAREILGEIEGANESESDDTKSGECAEALRKILSGPDGAGVELPSVSVKAELREAGYSEKVIKTAKKRLRVAHRRDGTVAGSPSYWKLAPGAISVAPGFLEPSAPDTTIRTPSRLPGASGKLPPLPPDRK